MLALIASANCACAGWNTNAWPSTDHWRFDTNEMAVATNVWAVRHVEAWTQTFTGANIPALAASNLWSHLGTLPGVAGNTRSWTNEYLTDIQADVTQATASVSVAYTNLYTNGADVLTTVLLHSTNGVQTNLQLQVMDVWGWESYLARRERWCALNGTGVTAELDFDVAYKPRYYRSSRDNLLETKAWIRANLDEFIDLTQTNAAGNYTDALQTGSAWTTNSCGQVFYRDFFGTYPTNWTWGGLVAKAGCPTNFFEPEDPWGEPYTPWRDLGGNGPSSGRVYTCQWVFPATGTWSVVDSVGSNHTIVIPVGTPIPYTNTVTVTNLRVQAGCTDADYGYKWIPALFALLVDTAVSPSYGSTNRNRYIDTDPAGATCEDRLANISTSWNAETSDTNNSIGAAFKISAASEQQFVDQWTIQAEIQLPLYAQTTNVQAAVHLYAVSQAPRNPIDGSSAGAFSDFIGSGLTNLAWVLWQTWTATNGCVRGFAGTDWSLEDDPEDVGDVTSLLACPISDFYCNAGSLDAVAAEAVGAILKDYWTVFKWEFDYK